MCIYIIDMRVALVAAKFLEPVESTEAADLRIECFILHFIVGWNGLTAKSSSVLLRMCHFLVVKQLNASFILIIELRHILYIRNERISFLL